MTKTDFITSFQDYLKQHDLVQPGAILVIGVSGGLDSIVLLDLLSRISDTWKLRLNVGHVHHGLRGRDADHDEAFVRDVCRRNGLTFYSLRCDVKTYAKQFSYSIEESARNLRLDFLESLLDRLGGDALVLAHHADDRAETILMHLIRGSGVRGLAGIRPRRDRIIHPLLFATRRELASYADERGLIHVYDKSNRSSRYLRNRIRGNVIPAMKQAFEKDVIRGIGRSGDFFEEAHRVVEALATSALSECVEINNPHEIRLDIERFLGYFKVVQKRIIVMILEEQLDLGRMLRSSEMDRIVKLADKPSGRRFSMDPDVIVLKSSKQLIFIRGSCTFKASVVGEGGAISIKDIGIRISAERVSKKNASFKSDPNSEIVDFDKVRFPLKVRPFQPGDWFIPLGMKGKKKLQDFFVDTRVSVIDRGRIPIVCSGDDVVWVAGNRLDHRYRIREKTERFLKLTVEYQDQS